MKRHLILLASLTLAGCNSPGRGSPGGSPPPTTPPPPAVTELAPGELFTGKDGVAVGAPEGAIDAPVTPTVEIVSLPSTPLPPGFVAIGDAYRIGATEFTEADAGKSLLIGLPVPAGEDAESLSLAELLPGAGLLGGLSEDVWAVRPAYADASRNLLLIAAASLSPDGSVYVLVKDTATASQASAAAPKMTETAATARKATAFAPLRAATETPPDPLVEVLCSPYFQSPCEQNDLANVEYFFQRLVDELVPLGYPLPYLGRKVVSVSATNPLESVEGPYLIELAPCDAVPSGYYDPNSRNLTVCIHPTVPPQELEYREHTTLMFNAFQFGFEPVRSTHRAAAPGEDEWFLTSMATAALYAGDSELARSPFEDFKQTVYGLLLESGSEGSGARENSSRRSQDFWVYLDERLGGLGLSLFHPFLSRGVRPQDVDDTLAEDYQNDGVPSLGQAYWEWAKNQAYEGAVLLSQGQGALDPPVDILVSLECYPQKAVPVVAGEPDPSSARYLGDFGDVFASEPLVDPDSGPLSVWPQERYTFANGRTEYDFGHLRRLSARLALIKLAGTRDYAVRISVQPDHAEVSYKVYDLAADSTSATATCSQDPDNASRIIQVAQGEDHDVAILVGDLTLQELDWGDPQYAGTKLIIEPVGLHLDRESSEIQLNEAETVADSFTIFNDTAEPIGFSAADSETWLTFTGNDSGVIPANGSVNVYYDVVCAAPNTTASTDIALLFTSADGAPLAGDDIPSVFHVDQACATTVPTCIDYWADYRGYTATATLTWTASGERIEGSDTYTGDFFHTATITTTYDMGDPASGIPASFVDGGFAQVDDIGTTSLSDGAIVTTTTWSGNDSPTDQYGNPAGIAASYASGDCTWGLDIVAAYVDGERNANGTVTEEYLFVGNMGLSGVAASGGMSVPLFCNGSSDRPECNGRKVTIGNTIVYLNLLNLAIDDPSVPQALLGWSIVPIPR